ncbi:hypothetical protein Tco_0270736 [Tanacetum coccineum]
MNMLTNLTMQKQSPSGSRSLPSNTVANPRGDVKAITTRSGVSYDGPTIPPTPSPLLKEVERKTKATKDKVQTTSTAHVQPPIVQVLIPEPKVALKPKPKPSIPYPSRLNNQKLLDYDVDPWVPLILGRPFLRTARALVDDNFKEELKIKKLSHHLSGSTTSSPTSSPSLTAVKTSDSLLEEFADKLGLLDPFPPGIGDADFDLEGDILLLEKLLNDDSSSPLPLKELNFEECKMIKSLIDDFPPLDVLRGNFMTFSNPLFDSNEEFTSSDDESPPEADVPMENFKIYSNPLFEFDEEYISSNVNPLFNEVLEDIESVGLLFSKP